MNARYTLDMRRPYKDPYEQFEDDYIAWLYSFVGKDTDQYGRYWRLIKRLYIHPFYVKEMPRTNVYKDVNRVRDGIALRFRFADEYGVNVESCSKQDPRFESFFDDNEACSMLEMLVALALRIRSDIMWDDDGVDRTPLWFWTMIANTGLDLERCKDEYFDENCIVEVAEMCSKIVNRLYEKTGKGSFFPTSFLGKDMRKIEIWYQMQFWIGENYPI